jgi:hypothetical protein
MANTFSNLVANTYKALDVVSRELTGFVNSVTLDADASAIPIGQTLYSVETPAVTSGSITAAVTPPDDGDQTIGSQAITITTQERVPFRWGGDEMAALNRGAGMSAVMNGQIQQAIRTLVNKMELAVWNEAIISASRAYGTAATTPFASDLSAAAQLRKILDDNGADGARSLIIDTAAGVKLRTLAQLTKVNEAGSQMTLRDGELLDLFGFSVKESAAVGSVDTGTGASYQLNGAHSAGATTITVDTGTGTILAGAVVTIGSHNYVVTSALSGGSFTIGAPGLKAAHADNVAVTVVADYTANVGFSQSAIVLAARTPYVPSGEMANNSEIITDPRTGLSFRLAEYGNYYRVQYEISAAWGAHGIKPAHTAILMG